MEIKLHDYGYVTAPFRAHPNDAGYDVFTRSEILIKPHTVVKIPLGFGVEVPPGYMAAIFPRGSMSLKGLLPQLPPIDCGYDGEIHAIVLNSTVNEVFLPIGSKIGQLVFIPVTHFDLVRETSEKRGANGFGSTDITTPYGKVTMINASTAVSFKVEDPNGVLEREMTDLEFLQQVFKE